MRNISDGGAMERKYNLKIVCIKYGKNIVAKNPELYPKITLPIKQKY